MGAAAKGAARLAPDQAAAAARLLMAGNRLPGIREAAFAAVPQASPRPAGSGEGGAGGGVPPAPATTALLDGGHVPSSLPASEAADSAASDVEGASLTPLLGDWVPGTLWGPALSRTDSNGSVIEAEACLHTAAWDWLLA